MRIVRALLLLATALPFFACSSSRVQTDFDHQADFRTFSTFAWYQAMENSGPTEGPSQIVDGRIRRAIEENLQARGSARPNPARPISQSPTTLRSTLRCNSTPPGGATEMAGVGGRTGGMVTVSGRVGPQRPSTPIMREPSSSTSSIEKKTNSFGGASPPEFSARRATQTRRSTNPWHEFLDFPPAQLSGTGVVDAARAFSGKRS